MPTTWPAAKNAGEDVTTTDWNALIAAMRSWPAPPAESVNANGNTLANLAALYVGDLYVTAGMDLAGKNLSNLGVLTFAAGGYMNGRIATSYAGGTGTIAASILHAGDGNSPGTALRVSNGYMPTAGAYEVFGVWLNNFTTSALTVRDSGKVGIGVQSPAHALDISGSMRLTGGNHFLYSDNNAFLSLVGGSAGGGGIRLMGNTDSPLTLVHIDGLSGNVGIGTTSHTGKLEVYSCILDQVLLKIGNVGGGFVADSDFSIWRASATGALHIQGNQTGYTNICLAPTSGNVGIGTDSPGARLTVVDLTASADQMRLSNMNEYYFSFGRHADSGMLWIQGNQAGVNDIALAPTSGYVIHGVPNLAIADARLGNSQAAIWFDEANNRLGFKCKTSGGVVKTGYVNVS